MSETMCQRRLFAALAPILHRRPAKHERPIGRDPRRNDNNNDPIQVTTKRSKAAGNRTTTDKTRQNHMRHSNRLPAIHPVREPVRAEKVQLVDHKRHVPRQSRPHKRANQSSHDAERPHGASQVGANELGQ